MHFRFFVYIILSAIPILVGCTHPGEMPCKPVLFPYTEYRYVAESKKLDGIYYRYDGRPTIQLFNLKLSVPNGWTHEKFVEDIFKFSSSDGRMFLFSFDKGRSFTNRAEEVQFVGCADVKSKEPMEFKTPKDYYTDLFHLTADQMGDDPTLWQCYILWSKTDAFRDAVKLTHFIGDNLEAFQKNSKQHPVEAILPPSQIFIFPKNITYDYITVTASFTDDFFFAAFLDMLNSLNP